jgi:hypothetical protein
MRVWERRQRRCLNSVVIPDSVVIPAERSESRDPLGRAIGGMGPGSACGRPG